MAGPTHNLWWNGALLLAIGGLFFSGMSLRERLVVHREEDQQVKLARLEKEISDKPHKIEVRRELAQLYIDFGNPGLALRLLDGPFEPSLEHLKARAYMEQGLSVNALDSETKVIRYCTHEKCPSWIVASATMRQRILRKLVEAGINDARANPEQSAVAIQGATHQMRIAGSADPSHPVPTLASAAPVSPTTTPSSATPSAPPTKGNTP